MISLVKMFVREPDDPKIFLVEVKRKFLQNVFSSPHA